MKKLQRFAAILAAAALIFSIGAFAVRADDDDEKKDIKLRIRTEVERGEAPLPVVFIAEIEADEELDQYIYESAIEWRVEGSFVLVDYRSPGDVMDPTMRRDPYNPTERMLRDTKHLVARERKRPPRKDFSEETEVPRTLQWEYEFDRPGKFYITLRLRNGKYISNQVEIEVRGDQTYDPFRDPY
jgi:hypothetical protein